MSVAPKYILHSPLSNEALLEEFVENALRANGSLIAVVGMGCERIEDIIDEIVVGDGQYEARRFIATTSHPDESYEEVFEFVELYDFGQDGVIHEVRL
ncbi:hypothetical protein [Kiloniella litopenaei]|uniref:hypothetical protein n=1 Tax=Kiloniella litopenaei TaxID=1549748 RepID=UPI003BAB1F6E